MHTSHAFIISYFYKKSTNRIKIYKFCAILHSILCWFSDIAFHFHLFFLCTTTLKTPHFRRTPFQIQEEFCQEKSTDSPSRLLFAYWLYCYYTCDCCELCETSKILSIFLLMLLLSNPSFSATFSWFILFSPRM